LIFNIIVSIIEKIKDLSMEKLKKMEIAEKARVFRAKTRIRQHDLAELCGVSQRIISFLETESWDKISEEKIDAIARVVCG
jgi:transcriptional regulator with XRE-family HTH domain